MSHDSPVTRNPSLEIRASRSLGRLLREAIAQLERAHVPSSTLTAELLLMHALGCDRTFLYAHPEQELDAEARERYASLIVKRASGVPTQQLTGHQEFWGLEFEITQDVLIPRPETEHVIEVALERLGLLSLSNPPRSASLRVADVGTGSGCIAVSLAHELHEARIAATDISPAALEVARRNAERHSVARRIEFIECNLLDPFLTQSPSFDLIASNPPYIGSRDSSTLQREVRDHEPETALFAGELGTEIYAPLITQAATLLKPDGILVLELGYNSAEHVLKLLESPEWVDVAITNDLAGIARVASSRRQPNA